MTGHLKVRLYDLAKELKLDTKRLIEEVRREGIDVSVPSNSVSKELADKIRNKYFPKKEATVKRAVRVVKKASRPVVEEAAPSDEEEAQPEPEPELILGRNSDKKGLYFEAKASAFKAGDDNCKQARAHLLHLFAEIARDVPHLRDPIAIILERLERAARGVAEVGPERGIRIHRHFVIAEALIRDQDLQLRVHGGPFRAPAGQRSNSAGRQASAGSAFANPLDGKADGKNKK